MKLVVHLLGLPLLDVELHLHPPCADRDDDVPALEATAGGDFGFGMPLLGRPADLDVGERPDIV